MGKVEWLRLGLHLDKNVAKACFTDKNVILIRSKVNLHIMTGQKWSLNL